MGVTTPAGNMGAPAFCTPPCSQHPTDVPTGEEVPQDVRPHPKVRSPHAAPALPAHFCVQAAPGAPWGGCAVQPRQGRGALRTLPSGTEHL